MLKITIPAPEMWDELREEFVVDQKDTVLQLEHSLVSISKWESKWKKPYYGREQKTAEEMLDYIRCMTITQNVDPAVYDRLTKEHMDQIATYMEDPMTATTFPGDKMRRREKTGRRPEIPTAELIEYWMLCAGIPWECRKWHINRLLTLIRVCDFKNSKPQKRSQADLAREHASINELNRKRFSTKG